MSEGYLPQWQPEPEPPNALERLMAKAVTDPSHHGEMFRKLLESELFLMIPARDLEPGDHEIAADESFQWCVFGDAEGAFTPVFTSLPVAEKRARQLPPGPPRAIIGMEARGLLLFLRGGTHPVRLIAAGAVEITLKPEALTALLEGKLTDARPAPGPAESLVLHPVAAADLPARLVEGVRSFCDKRRVPIGVYAFQADDPGSGERMTGELRIILWLRDSDNRFFNDFSLMAQKLAPDHEIVIGVVTPDMSQAVEFVSARRPLWPALDD
jgi:hypothetical protein